MSLYEASFKIKHECPYRELSEQYPDLTVREWHLDDCQVLEISAMNASYEEVAEKIESMGEILHKSGDDSELHIVARSCGCPLEDSIVQRLESHNCLYMPPAVYKQGWEHYTVTAFDRGDVEKLLQELDGDREIEVISKTSLRKKRVPYSTLMSTERLFDGLTSRQLDALRVALDNGYYKEPRETSVAELSDRTEVARSTYEEHLRKAENKLISNAGELVRLITQKRDEYHTIST